MIGKIVFKGNTIFDSKKTKIEKDRLLIQIYNNQAGAFVVYCGDKKDINSPHKTEVTIPFEEIRGFHPEKLIHRFGKFNSKLFAHYFNACNSEKEETLNIGSMICELQKETLQESEYFNL